MHPITNLLCLAALAATARAQANSEPRTPRPIPPQSSVKVDASAPLTTSAIERGASLDPTAIPAAPRKLAGTESKGTRATPPQHDRLYYTTQADGSTWVSGRTYKARFGPGGATYVPYLGSQAPRNFPLELSLASATVGGVEIPLAAAASAVREGDRVVIDRGPIDEVYELGLDSVEQTFVVAERPGSGDLRFVVRLQTEMTRAEDTDGFTYSNEHGSVRYGRAFVREPNGDRLPIASRLVEGGIEIVVGRDDLDHASFPLVVDPVISTFPVYTTNEDTWDSDSSYDLTTDRYLTVFEFNFSQADGDIYAVLREGNGSNSYFGLFDNTVENWRSPQCANLNASNQFLMVAQVANVTGALNWNIWGMTVDAATLANSFKFLISTADQTGAKYLGDVGGDPYDGPGASYYCVTWRRDFTTTDWDIHARLVTAQGTLVGPSTLFIDNSGSSKDSWPSVSKSNGTLGGAAAWTIAWHRELTNTNYDLYAARLAWDGTLLNSSTQLTSGAGLEYYPRVSSPLDDGRSLVVWSTPFGSENDLYYLLLSGTSVDAIGDLTALEALPTQVQNQIEYSVDSDGQRFVVAYAESYASSTFDYDIWVSTFAPFGGALARVEGHRSLDFSTTQALRTDIVAQRSGGAIGSNRFYVSWDTTGGLQHDIQGGLYDRPIGGGYEPFCFGDGSGLACPCSNSGSFQRGCQNSANASGAGLGAGGNAQTGLGDSLVFQVNGVPPNVSCTLFQGTASSGGVLFGDGVRCVAGTQVRIRTKNADATGVATWPTGVEPAVSVTGLIPGAGAQRYYQVSYRNAASFCTPATFNISNGIRVLWLP
ncbi:MAG: hypothetical protein NTY35_05325 [Planctomycetota bacterium]|nr:hypothetical protein [Planctomycetota bacterium]